MTMNLRQMEVFRAVMLSGGVTSAAELLHVTPTAVSKVLGQAARSSGLVLFERVKGRLIPTPEAHRLYAEVDELWRGVEKVHETARELAEPTRTSLRLVLSSSVAPFLASRAVYRLYEQFTRLQCSIQVHSSAILNQVLVERSAHLGVALMPQSHPNLATVKAYQCGLACVMRSDHPLAALDVITPGDLHGERVILSPSSTSFGQTIRRALAPVMSEIRDDFEVMSSTTACWFAQAGVGIAVVDQVAIAAGLLAGLEVRPFRSQETLSVRIIRNRYRPMSVVERAFVDIFDQVWDSMTRHGSAANP